MEKVLACRDLGMDCDCEVRGETASDILARIMEHIRMDHDLDWFEVEDVHQAALARIRDAAA